jgi:hypothetical protein
LGDGRTLVLERLPVRFFPAGQTLSTALACTCCW